MRLAGSASASTKDVVTPADVIAAKLDEGKLLTADETAHLKELAAEARRSPGRPRSATPDPAEIAAHLELPSDHTHVRRFGAGGREGAVPLGAVGDEAAAEWAHAHGAEQAAFRAEAAAAIAAANAAAAADEREAAALRAAEARAAAEMGADLRHSMSMKLAANRRAPTLAPVSTPTPAAGSARPRASARWGAKARRDEGARRCSRFARQDSELGVGEGSEHSVGPGAIGLDADRRQMAGGRSGLVGLSAAVRRMSLATRDRIAQTIRLNDGS